MITYQLLHLEDNPSDAELVLACLDASAIRYNIALVTNQADYLQALTEKLPDLVISDFRLRYFDGIQAFQFLQEHNTVIPFILLSGALRENNAVECLKLGMTDFILKHHLERLPPLVERALREAQERRERIAAQAALLERHQEIEDLNKRLQRAIWESQHRIKNNLQILNGLVDAMRTDKTSGSPQSLERLASHIRGLATLHDVLSYQTNTPGVSLDRLSARLALERLIPAMASVLAPRTLTLDAEDVELTVKQVTSLS
ncbi:response regulator, partial [Armatimonas sp.]|uniref:response regulator n=1 Tax=Armatimonas sp. TaxID=1872638 RepID=UPI0037506368